MNGSMGHVRRLRPVAAVLAVLLIAVACGGSPNQDPSEGEERLGNGVRLDLRERCEPHREELPAATLAAIQCSNDDASIGVRLFLFNREAELMAAYFALLEDAGVAPQSDALNPNGTELSYAPGEDAGEPVLATRNAWYVDAAGHAHYVATLPPFVLVSAESLFADTEVLQQWSWLGNQDVPGAPTLWRDGSPLDPFQGKGGGKG